MKKIILTALFMGILLGGHARNTASPFQAVVAQDGSGDYTSIQAAIDAVPDNRQEPWLIFVKNGSYREHVVIPETKTYVHLIGQDKDKTIIHQRRLFGNIRFIIPFPKSISLRGALLR